MSAKEAKARIKINKLLEESGWRFFDHATGKANIVLEPKVKLTKAIIGTIGALGSALLSQKEWEEPEPPA